MSMALILFGWTLPLTTASAIALSVWSMLNKLRINRHMPRAVLYAPLQLGGLNYPSFQIHQDQLGIMTMLKHFRWNKTVGNDMLVVLSTVQLLSGLCEPIMEDVTTNLSYVANGWFMHQRRRLKELNASMWIEHQWTPKLQRINDHSLMKTFSTLDGITDGKLAKANWCRIYLRVITLANIASERGDVIPGDRMNGKWRAKSNLEWPDIPCPPSSYWSIFRWCMRKAFANTTRPGRLVKPVRLDRSLQSWLPVERHIEYQFYRTAHTAYNRNGSNYLTYTEPTERGLFFAHGTTTTLPIDSQPISARFDEECLWTNQQYDVERTTAPSTPHITLTTSPSPYGNVSGSDGSVDPITGDRACSYAISNDGYKYSGRKRFPSNPHANSYRSELEGIKGVVNLAIENNIRRIDLTCDNKAAVRGIMKPVYKQSQVIAPEADIIMSTQQQIRSHNIDFHAMWVRGHQDRTTPPEELNDATRLNIDCDRDANEARLYDPIHLEGPYAGSGAMIKIDGRWITTKYREQLQLASIRRKHIKFFLKKYEKQHKTITDYNNIHWKAIGDARRTCSPVKNIRIAKFMNGWLNSGRQKGLFGKCPQCPACGWHEETQLHMYQCSHPEVKSSQRATFKLLERYYHQHHVPPAVYIPFTKLCWKICNKEPHVIHDPLTQTVNTAINKQLQLGTEFMLRGYLVPEWSQAIIERNPPNIQSSINHLYLGSRIMEDPPRGYLGDLQ